MRRITDLDEIESIARGVGASARVEIIKFLQKEGSPKTLTQIANYLKDRWSFVTLQNHCRILAEENIVEMKKVKGRYEVELLKIPIIFIEEIKKR